MALWGNNDSVYSDGTVTVDYNTLTITGSGTTFDANGVSVGDVIQIGAGSTFGEAVIVGVASTALTIASTQFLSGGAISGAIYNINQQPKYALGVGETYRGNVGPSLIYGVDANEVSAASTTQYAVTHSGWVGVTTYMADDGAGGQVLRVKHEVLVAGGISTTTDANDDALFLP